MGGNALKEINCVRVSKEIYKRIKEDVINRLKDKIKIMEIYEVPNKEDFGDLDLLVNEYVFEIVKEEFKPISYKINGNVLSFSYELEEKDKYFQIDLIRMDNMEMGQFYFSYGDVGSIIGRIVNYNKMKFGQNGIWINYKDDNIILSDNRRDICEYIGLEYKKWEDGFKKEEDIYEWIIGSKYFNKIYFEEEYFNYRYKDRLKDRKMFVNFIKYIEKIENNNIKLHNIEDHINYFNKWDKIKEVDEKERINKIIQDKYSGKIFMKYLDAKMINKFKIEFKKYIETKEEFNKWIERESKERIEEEIREYILNYKSV